jgi:hypothetical protein
MRDKVELLAAIGRLAGDTYPNGPTESQLLRFRDRVEAAAWAGYTGLGIVHQDLVAVRDKIGYAERCAEFAATTASSILKSSFC